MTNNGPVDKVWNDNPPIKVRDNDKPAFQMRDQHLIEQYAKTRDGLKAAKEAYEENPSEKNKIQMNTIEKRHEEIKTIMKDRGLLSQDKAFSVGRDEYTDAELTEKYHFLKEMMEIIPEDLRCP